MYLHGLSAVKDYLDLIFDDDPEAAHLASDLMIGVTSFFRDRVAWKALNLEAIRKIAAENTDLPGPRLDPGERHGRRGLLHRHDASAGSSLSPGKNGTSRSSPRT